MGGQLSEQRNKSLELLADISQCDVELVTMENIDVWVLSDHPLHPAFKYLSAVHKSEYMRTYLMHFYGGGYSDVKLATGSWETAFRRLEQDPLAWMSGYPEVEGGVVPGLPAGAWSSLIGNGAYIAKPHTQLTQEWYTEMMAVMDTHAVALRRHPAAHPRERCEAKSQYPICWTELLGQIFHPIAYRNRERLLKDVPMPNCNNYQ